MPHDSVTRTSREVNLGWAENNPQLFVQTVKSFQAETPITHWQHFIDLSRNGYVTFHANRRETPFLDTKEYLAHSSGNRFLKEIGMRQ